MKKKKCAWCNKNKITDPDHNKCYECYKKESGNKSLSTATLYRQNPPTVTRNP